MVPGSSSVPWSPDVPQTRPVEGTGMQPPVSVPPGNDGQLVSAIAVIWFMMWLTFGDKVEKCRFLNSTSFQDSGLLFPPPASGPRHAVWHC